MPIKQAGYSHIKADARLNKKRQEADIRQAKYDVLSIQERLALPHLGKKERTKLEKRLATQKATAPKPAPVAVVEAKPAKAPKKSKKS